MVLNVFPCMGEYRRIKRYLSTITFKSAIINDVQFFTRSTVGLTIDSIIYGLTDGLSVLSLAFD